MSLTSDAFVRIPGRARALRAPNGGAPKVVLLHGAGGNADTFRPCLDAWSWADVWCLDLPGRGGSHGPAFDDVGALAAWVRAFFEAAHIRPTVVGHSLGGAVGLELALSSPDAIAGLVMVSSAARLRVAPKLLEAAGSTKAPMRLDFAFAATDTPMVERYHRYSDLTPVEAAAADWAACDGFDVRDRLDELSAPLALLWGEDDALTPARFQRWLAQRTGAHAEWVAGVGHMLPWEAPAAVSTAVEAWLAASTQP